MWTPNRQHGLELGKSEAKWSCWTHADQKFTLQRHSYGQHTQQRTVRQVFSDRKEGTYNTMQSMSRTVLQCKLPCESGQQTELLSGVCRSEQLCPESVLVSHHAATLWVCESSDQHRVQDMPKNIQHRTRHVSHDPGMWQDTSTTLEWLVVQDRHAEHRVCV